MAATVTVKYWRGTTQHEGKAKTYRGAMRLASKNQNAFPATFFDADDNKLYDTGYGLAYPEPDSEGRIVCVL